MTLFYSPTRTSELLRIYVTSCDVRVTHWTQQIRSASQWLNVWVYSSREICNLEAVELKSFFVVTYEILPWTEIKALCATDFPNSDLSSQRMYTSSQKFGQTFSSNSIGSCIQTFDRYLDKDHVLWPDKGNNLNPRTEETCGTNQIQHF